MVRFLLVSLSLMAILGPANSSCAAGRPHIVFFLVDDLGWSDLGCYGSTYHETPNIDAFCRSGMKFTQAYTAASICSPTRASLMSGKHPVRVNITDWIPGAKPPNYATLLTPQDQHQLDLEEVTFAEVLKEAGYKTYYGGKWHLGGEGYGPTEQGFDEYFDPPSWKSRNQRQVSNQTESRPHGTREITREALRFLSEHAGGERPLLVFLSYHDVHTPIIEDPRRIEYYKQKRDELPALDQPLVELRHGKTKRRQDNPRYATMVDAVDQSIHTVLAKLDELEITDNTVVVFYSDNGGLATLRHGGPTSNAPLRSGKGWLYEGGIRVPLAIRAPGITQAGTICETPVVSMDLYPTLLELAGCSPRPKQHVDGMSLVSLLEESSELDERSLYWHYPHYHGSTWEPGGAIRSGSLKLIEFFATGEAELYDLSEDIGELNDLAEDRPEVVERLRGELQAWRTSLEAAMPTPLATD